MQLGMKYVNLNKNNKSALGGLFLQCTVNTCPTVHTTPNDEISVYKPRVQSLFKMAVSKILSLEQIDTFSLIS